MWNGSGVTPFCTLFTQAPFLLKKWKLHPFLALHPLYCINFALHPFYFHTGFFSLTFNLQNLIRFTCSGRIVLRHGLPHTPWHDVLQCFKIVYSTRILSTHRQSGFSASCFNLYWLSGVQPCVLSTRRPAMLNFHQILPSMQHSYNQSCGTSNITHQFL